MFQAIGVCAVLLSLAAAGNGSTIIDPENRFLYSGHGRIFGGHRAQKGQFPYQASLRANIGNNKWFHYCGGSIITNRFVVTAAHCLSHETSLNESKVVLGAHNISGDGIGYDFKKIFIHPNWDPTHILHDVGLVLIDRVIEYTTMIQPIEISREFVNTSYRAVTSGWGRTNDEADSLKYAFLYTMTNDECRARISLPDSPIHDFSTLCGYSIRVGTGVCSGDSGNSNFCWFLSD